MNKSNTKTELKSHQIDNIYASDDIPFHDLSKGVASKLVFFGTGLFLLLLLLSFIITIPREINIPFELKGGLSEDIYQYPENVYIEDFFVQTFDQVDTGTALFSITSPRIVSYLEEFTSAQNQLELYNNSKRKANEQEIAVFKNRKEGLLMEIEKVNEEKSRLKSAGNKETLNLELQLQNRQSQFKRSQELHKNDVISDQELEQAHILLQVAQQNLISKKEGFALKEAEINSRLQLLQNDYSQLIAEITKAEADFDYELNKIIRDLSLAQSKIRLNYGPFKVSNSAITLLSNIRGKVNLKTENEYAIAAGEIILRIQTDSNAYFAYTAAASKDIGFIENGTKAILKFSSYPHYYYGTMEARVASISNSPTEAGNYPINLQIIKTGRLENKVTKGMTGNASFVVEEMPVINYIAKAFLKAVTIN